MRWFCRNIYWFFVWWLIRLSVFVSRLIYFFFCSWWYVWWYVWRIMKISWSWSWSLWISFWMRLRVGWGIGCRRLLRMKWVWKGCGWWSSCGRCSSLWVVFSIVLVMWLGIWFWYSIFCIFMGFLFWLYVGGYFEMF